MWVILHDVDKVFRERDFFFSRFHSCSKQLILQTELGHKCQHRFLLSWKLHYFYLQWTYALILVPWRCSDKT